MEERVGVLVAARNACKITVVKRIRLHLIYECFGTKLEYNFLSILVTRIYSLY